MSYLYLLLIKETHPLRSDCIKSQVVKAGALTEAPPNDICFPFCYVQSNDTEAFLLGFSDHVYSVVSMIKPLIFHAYPFLSLTLVLVLMASALFYEEPIAPLQSVVMALSGLSVGSQD
jgi:hypothetical protein